MKKLVALLTVLAFALTLASSVDAATTKKAVKKAVKKVAKKVVKKAVTKKVVAPRPMAPVAPVPPPPPMAPAPRPTPVVAPAPTGMFGMGLKTDISLGYIAGKSVIAGRADIILADMLGMGPMVGLSDKAVTWKIGLGGASGKDVSDVEKKAIPLFVDGVINLPADLLGGVESYIGGGINYVLYGSEKKSGSIGGQVYAGIQGDLGLGGKSFVEVAYSIIRSGTGSLVQPYSMKGIGINVGQQILL